MPPNKKRPEDKNIFNFLEKKIGQNNIQKIRYKLYVTLTLKTSQAF